MTAPWPAEVAPAAHAAGGGAGVALIAAALVLPWACFLFFTLGAYGHCARRPVMALALALAPAPAIAAALFAPDGAKVAADAFLWGARFGADATGRPFLLAVGLTWALAGLYAAGSIAGSEGRARFSGFWLAALGGNVALVLARDLAAFYAGFAVMTFAAYGLIIHARERAATVAGRVYLALMLLGEVALLAGIALVAAAGGSEALAFERAAAEASGTARALFALGFGIKLGVLGLHSWLPRAHAAAPTAASAVLSGAMVKAGALGALRIFGAPAEGGPAELGAAAAALGIAGALYGAAMGVWRGGPKTALAWSTVSQMGLVLTLLAVAYAAPEARAIASATAAFFALHHGLAKAALFAGAGILAFRLGRARGAARAAICLPALALAGAPVTTGWIAKSGLDAAAELSPHAGWLVPALYAATMATTVLMLRAVGLVWAEPEAAEGAPPRVLWLAWVGLLAAPWIAGAAARDIAPALKAIELKGVLAASWPIALGGALYAAAVGFRARGGRAFEPRVEPGEGAPRLETEWRRARAIALCAERALQRFPVIGYLLVATLAGLAAALWP